MFSAKPQVAWALTAEYLGPDLTSCSTAQAVLEREGFLVTAIRPPTVPAGTARLRFAFAAGHPDTEIARLAHLVRENILT